MGCLFVTVVLAQTFDSTSETTETNRIRHGYERTAPLFFGKPGQFTEVTTWCQITFRLQEDLSQDKSKQAAFNPVTAFTR